MVDISGIDKLVLLQELWIHATPASFFIGENIETPPFDMEIANNIIKNGYLRNLDYFQGRAIKTDISGDRADPIMYDVNHGCGMFQKIVDDIRNGNKRFINSTLKTCSFKPAEKSAQSKSPESVVCAHCGKPEENHYEVYSPKAVKSTNFYF